MDETLTIAKPSDPRPSEDYALLRKTGLEYIEKLGHKVWTDFNIHDPGITILEMLAYAITDLDFRTSFDIRDLLALRKDGRSKSCDPDAGDCPKYFHTALDILTVNPVTINDYRKLVIDVEGVRNAWMLPSTEQECAFYLDLKEQELTYDAGIAPDLNTEIILNGLYKILLEFEEDDDYGDLNDPVIEAIIDVGGEDTEFELVFPRWTDLAYPEAGTGGCMGSDPVFTTEQALIWVRYGTTTSISLIPADICFESDVDAYRVRLTVDFDFEKPNPPADPDFVCGTDMPLPDPEAEEVEVDPGTTAGSDSLELDVLVKSPLALAEMQTELLDLLKDNVNARLIEFYREKLAATLYIVDMVQCRLMNHRNLCEDLLRIESLKSEEIALCADIEVGPMANIDEVLAEIYYQVGNFIAPPINFYTLEEMFAKGYKSDEIFNGPVPSHGFIDNVELDAAILRTELHTSDIINIIMDIEGVVAVRDLQIANWVSGTPVNEGEKWVLPLMGDNLHVPRLSPDKSKILFFRDVLPYRADEDNVAELLGELKAKDRKVRLKEIELDIVVPEGFSQDVDEYQTIQNDFPLTYGIGEDGIPGNPDEARKAKARQLKGFLLFFDQLLANYLSQLAHVGELFSMEEGLPVQSYFVQSVRDLRDIESLYSAYNAGGVDEDAKFAPVETAVQTITEDQELAEERKNRFLDHLMGRFAESFSEYSVLMYDLQEAVAPAELIEDKLAFLGDYPAISRDRGKAFNYRPLEADCLTCDPEQLWNTDENVSGYKKRVTRLLGIDDYHRRNLTCHCFGVHEIDYGAGKYGYVWYLRDPLVTDPGDVKPMTHEGILLRSIEYETEDSARFMITYAIAMIEDGYLVQEPELGTYSFDCCEKVGEAVPEDIVETSGFRFVLSNPCGDPIACSPDYALKPERNSDYVRTLAYVLEFCTVEGMHVVEHILLRPKSKHDHFLPVCVDHTGDVAIGASGTDMYIKLYYEMYEDAGSKWRFKVVNHKGQTVLFSQAYGTIKSARHGMREVKKYRLSSNNYDLKSTPSGKYYFYLQANNGEHIAKSRYFSTKKKRNDDMNAMRCFDPAAEAATGETESSFCMEDADPYSFRMSVVLPSWAGRFRNINYRQLVEKTLRLEAPAHIALKICWIDRWQMADFECAYMEWLLANGACDATPATVTPKLNALIDVMNKLQNVYPVATLHDCDDTAGQDSQVVLNFTSLGTL